MHKLKIHKHSSHTGSEARPACREQLVCSLAAFSYWRSMLLQLQAKCSKQATREPTSYLARRVKKNEHTDRQDSFEKCNVWMFVSLACVDNRFISKKPGLRRACSP